MERRLLWEYGGDILRSPNMAIERRIPQHGAVNCFDHSVAVALLSLWLVRRLHLRLDRRSLVRGALLHDYFLYDWHDREPSHRLHGFCHAQRALENAEREFRLNKVEADIIEKHMFPLNLAPPRFRESAVVCCADKVCAVRETVSGLRRLPLLRSFRRKTT